MDDQKKKQFLVREEEINISSQNEGNEKLAAALIKANRELAHQNAENEKRAAELVLINKELAFQIEEKEKRAAELETAIKELESFSYSVSHDLRAPLRAINGFTHLLAEEYAGQLEEEAKVFLEEIIANSKKMSQLIDNLLEFSRIGKQLTSIAEINSDEMVKSVLVELKQLEPNRDIQISIEPLPNINGDRYMLKQVFINLISNAFKYTSKKPVAQIQIGSFQDTEYYTFYVKDNGAGFDMRYYDKLFGVFQRLHSSNEFEGTGVGLAIIQKIVSKHGGKVWAEGQVNEGACFYISLPIIY